jgi:hypothetical protein
MNQITGVDGESKPRKSIWNSLGFGENEDETAQEHKQMTTLLMSVWDGVDVEQLVDMVEGETSGGGLRQMYSKLSVVMKIIADSKIFQNFIIFVILLAGTLVGLQTDKKFERDNEVRASARTR